jgi:hypothetical protein
MVVPALRATDQAVLWQCTGEKVLLDGVVDAGRVLVISEVTLGLQGQVAGLTQLVRE